MITAMLAVDVLWLTLQNLWVFVNLRVWPRPQAACQDAARLPTVSLLIPARDEARRIATCIAQARAQTYPLLEIAVLDDQSGDATFAISLAAARGDSRVHVLPGTKLPAGVYGKAHACHQLSIFAHGEWLLFVDADTNLEPSCVSQLIATATFRGSDVITGFPRVANDTLTGWLATSMMVFTIATHLPVGLIERSKNPRFVAGSGMVMMLSREAYAQIGGHAAAGQHIVDDMAMLRAAKAAGLQVSLVDLSQIASVRMYDTKAEVWQGFSKNLYAGLGRSPLLLGFVVTLYIFWYILPLLMIAALSVAAFAHLWDAHLTRWLAYSSLASALGILLKGQTDHRFGVPAKYSLCAPLSAALLIGIGLHSFWQDIRGHGHVWKGRRYS